MMENMKRIDKFNIEDLEQQLEGFQAWLWANYSKDGLYPLKFTLTLTQDSLRGLRWRASLHGEPTLATDDVSGLVSWIVDRVSDWQIKVESALGID